MGLSHQPDIVMTAPVSIRPLLPSDAQAFRELRLEALANHPEAFSSSYEEESPLGLEEFQARIPVSGPNAIFGAFADGRLVGMAAFVIYDRPKARHKGLMWGVFVKPERRGQHIGKTLVQSVIARASHHVIMLEAAVVLTNESARRTYHGLGFRPYGIEPKAIRLGDTFYDEELLYLDLPQPTGP
jgi:ribosomal protein S18 acetylase RimI-like enzyme